MKVGWPAIFLLIAAMESGPAIAQAKHHSSTEQTHFSAEDEGVEKPAVIPGDVLVILKQDRRVRNFMKNEEPPSQGLPLSWFSASAVHLSNPREEDLVVVGVGELRGANVSTFWVFRPTTHGHELIMMAPAHDLVVTRARWNGYREIELLSATATKVQTVLLRFDGKRYASKSDKWEDIR
jgi:hypothetical protein